LKNKLCRTPLDPLQTFIDDPLRVLRSIRFATRFGFEIADEIYYAAKDERVREAFGTKITYERIMKEMDKMFESRES
jgi:tRNA nucleotidyltransferase (CCA-adding enzyme)